MEPVPAARDDPWLKCPLRTRAGSLILAGSLRDVTGLDPQSMRILGRYALILILDGAGCYCDANGREMRFAAGDAILLFPEIAHAYGPDPGRSWQQVYVVFDGPQFDLLRESGILDPGDPIWRVEPPDYWRRRLEDVFQTARQDEATALRTIGQFVHVLTDMAATHAEATRPQDKRWLADSVQLLAEPAEHGWMHPKAVARHVGLSYENFRKLFARHTGIAPGRYQRQRRIEHACSAIYQGSRSFKEISDELGFCDVFHFSKAFREVVGESPSAFRKKVRGV